MEKAGSPSADTGFFCPQNAPMKDKIEAAKLPEYNLSANRFLIKGTEYEKYTVA